MKCDACRGMGWVLVLGPKSDDEARTMTAVDCDQCDGTGAL